MPAAGGDQSAWEIPDSADRTQAEAAGAKIYFNQSLVSADFSGEGATGGVLTFSTRDADGESAPRPSTYTRCPQLGILIQI